jgi:hypothetical protein
MRAPPRGFAPGQGDTALDGLIVARRAALPVVPLTSFSLVP